MHTSFNHLPGANQQKQLEYLVRIITDSLDIETIIYFGSGISSTVIRSCFAHEGIESNYQYEYDLLIIPRAGDGREDYEIQDIAESRCRDYARVNATVCRMDVISNLLRKGSVFYNTVFHQGVLLYNSGRLKMPFVQVSAAANARNAEAEKDWDILYKDAVKFLIGAEFYVGRQDLRHAVFLLHQATERICSAMIRVFTGLHTNTHNLNKLLRYTRLFSMEPASVFPRNTPEEIHLFDLLFRGYSDARYRQNYLITEVEADILVSRLHKLHEVAERICGVRLSAYSAAAGKPPKPFLEKINGGKSIDQ